MVVTLWGSAAEGAGAELEAAADANPVVAFSSCKVGLRALSLLPFSAPPLDALENDAFQNERKSLMSPSMDRTKRRADECFRQLILILFFFPLLSYI